MEKIGIVRTKRRYPAFWESGGWRRNSGYAWIVAGPEGEPKEPLFVQEQDFREHALFPLGLDDHLIHAQLQHGHTEVSVYRVQGFEGNSAIVELVTSYFDGEWFPFEPEGMLAEAADAALGKASCYHCRHMHWGEDGG